MMELRIFKRISSDLSANIFVSGMTFFVTLVLSMPTAFSAQVKHTSNFNGACVKLMGSDISPSERAATGKKAAKQISLQGHSTVFLNIVKMAAEGFRYWKYNPNDSTWPAKRVSWPVYSEGDLNDLTDEEKRHLLSEFRKSDPSLSSIPLILRIALDPSKDSEAWIAAFEYTTDISTFMKDTVRNISPYVDQVPQKTRKYILKRIGEKYPEASKELQGNWVVTTPKRALDLWVRMLLPVDKIFDDSLKTNKSALEAYRRYFNAIQKSIIDQMPENDQLYGMITVDDILALARAVNKSLVKKGYRGSRKKIYFHGSVVKGFAKKGSDLDTLTTNMTYGDYGLICQPHMVEDSIPIDDPTTPVYMMQKVADKLLPELELSFSLPHEFGEEFSKMTILEPILIEISAQGINILVISSRNSSGSIGSDASVDCRVGLNCARYVLHRTN